jgi:hypothetical protein
MNLPVAYPPRGVSDDESTKRLLLEAVDVWNKTKKPGLADVDEFADFCRAADAIPARPSPT